MSKFNTLWEGLALLVAFRLWLPSLPFGAVYRANSDNLGFLRALYGALERKRQVPYFERAGPRVRFG